MNQVWSRNLCLPKYTCVLVCAALTGMSASQLRGVEPWKPTERDFWCVFSSDFQVCVVRLTHFQALFNTGLILKPKIQSVWSSETRRALGAAASPRRGERTQRVCLACEWWGRSCDCAYVSRLSGAVWQLRLASVRTAAGGHNHRGSDLQIQHHNPRWVFPFFFRLKQSVERCVAKATPLTLLG